MNEEQEYNKTIDLLEVLKAFWSHKFLILLLVLVAGTIAFVKVQYFTRDTYTADGQIAVSSKDYSAGGSISSSDYTLSKNMALTYVHILQCREFMADVSEDTKGATSVPYTWKQISKATKISVVDNTELLKVTVTMEEKDDAAIIAESILRLAPDKLKEQYPDGTITVPDGVMGAEKNSRGLMKNLAIFMLVGFVLGAGIVFLIYFFDTKVHKAEDITKKYGVSILGELGQ